MPEKMLLNIGCGSRFCEGWVNIDKTPFDRLVRACDVLEGLPFPSSTFEVVYHSHLIEHLSKANAAKLLGECYRVLKSGGIIRVVAPDLERIAELYLEALDNALKGDSQWQHNYDWMMMELFDQFSRDRSGGAMNEYLKQKNIPNVEFVRSRIGSFAFPAAVSAPDAEFKAMPFRSRLVGFLGNFTRSIREAILSSILCKTDYAAMKIGRFRINGEVHLWMYDRYSLKALLQDAGFKNITLCGPIESMIPNWSSYNLDTEPDGMVYKPDSIYMESQKP